MADTDEIEVEMEAIDPRDEEKPRGRTSLLTVLLIVGNVLAMAGFAVMLYLDLGTRLEWSRAVFLRDLAMVGLPMDEKDSRSNADAGLQLKHELDPPLIKQAYKDRGGTMSDKFLPVSENFKADIRFADLDDNLLAVYFRDSGAGTPVVFTVLAEKDRIKNSFLSELDNVANEVADKAKGKSAAEKRALAKKILFPICTDGSQVLSVNARIYDEAKTPDNKLNEFLVAAAQRRMLYDILQALELFRPTEAVEPPDPEKVANPKFKKLLVDNVADLDAVKIEDLKQHFRKRCDDMTAAKDWIHPNIDRPNYEKRRAVAFLMVTISQIEIPGADRVQAPEAKKDADGKAAKAAPEWPVAFPKFKRRAEAVCGLQAFNESCQDLVVVSEILESQTVEAIHRDIGTYRYPVTTRIYYPKKFAEQLVGLMTKMDIPIPDGFQSALEERLKKAPGKIDGSEALMAELKALNVKIPDTTVEGLLNANALGFLGQYEMALKRVQELALLVDIRKRQYDEVKKQEDAENKQLKDRRAHEDGILKELVMARAKTRELAETLQVLQQELFVAQVNLAVGHEFNLYLADYLKGFEKKAQSKGGAGK